MTTRTPLDDLSVIDSAFNKTSFPESYIKGIGELLLPILTAATTIKPTYRT